MKIKCNNHRSGRCNADAIMYLEYTGERFDDKPAQVVATCDRHSYDWDQDNWRIISEEEYIVARCYSFKFSIHSRTIFRRCDLNYNFTTFLPICIPVIK